MSVVATIILGIVGSFAGGFLQPAGIIGSIIGAVIVLVIRVAVRRRRTPARW